MVSELDTEKFIEAVHARPPLWNKLDPMHRNLDLTNKLWNGIVEEMGCTLTVAELKQKWHNLRDCFRREVRIAQAGKKKKRWIYYNQMLFLLTPQCIKLNVQENRVHEIIVQDRALFPVKIETDEIVQLEMTNSDSNNSEFENISHKNAIEPTKDCSSLNNCQTEMVNGESENPAFCEIGDNSQHRIILSPDKNENSKSSPQAGESNEGFRIQIHDDDYHFALSIVPHMRHVPTHRKLRMRIRISEIIAQEAGYSEL